MSFDICEAPGTGATTRAYCCDYACRNVYCSGVSVTVDSPGCYMQYRGVNSVPVMPLVIDKNYWDRGFFNITIDFDQPGLINSGEVTLILGDGRNEGSGRAERNSNRNGTPRVFGRTRPRDWFQGNYRVGDTVLVELLGSNRIWIHQVETTGSCSLPAPRLLPSGTITTFSPHPDLLPREKE